MHHKITHKNIKRRKSIQNNATQHNNVHKTQYTEWYYKEYKTAHKNTTTYYKMT